MASSVKARQAGKITILEPGERLMVGPTAEEVAKQIQHAVASGCLALLLDCTHVSFIDSQGIMVIVRGVASLGKRGGKLKLLNLNPPVQRVLDITRLLTVIESFENESAALRSFD